MNNWSRNKKEAQSVQDTKDCKVDIANLLFIKTGI